MLFLNHQVGIEMFAQVVLAGYIQLEQNSLQKITHIGG